MKELFKACELGVIKLVRRLVEQGADIEAKDNDGWTPLHYAVYFNHFEIVQFLTEQGANIDTKDESNRTPLIFAAHYDQLEIVKYLVEKGANIKRISP